MSYFTYKLGPIATKIADTTTGCRFTMLGDSTAAQYASPRWGRSVLRGWNTPRAGIVCYNVGNSTAEEGWQDIGLPASSAAPGATLDGKTVPAGFTTRYATFGSDSSFYGFAQLYASALTKYAQGNPAASRPFQIHLVQLGTNNPLAGYFVDRLRTGGTIQQSYGQQTAAPTAGSGQWHLVSLPNANAPAGSYDDVYWVWSTSNSYNETGKTWNVAGYRVDFTGAVGLHYGAIAVPGYRLLDHLPSTLNAGSIYSDAERVAKFDTLGWPHVIGVALGINMATDEASSIGGVWKDRMRRLLDWHVGLYATRNKPAPLFLLINPWATDSSESRRAEIEQALAEIADARNDTGVINLYRLVKQVYGAYSSWQSTLLADGIHQSAAGADAFGALSWAAIDGARWAPVASSGTAPVLKLT